MSRRHWLPSGGTSDKDWFRDSGLTTVLGAAKMAGVDHKIMLRLVKEGHVPSELHTPPGFRHERRLVRRDVAVKLRERMDAILGG
jgi:hypothetical protein